jgi:hypothetical protein
MANLAAVNDRNTITFAQIEGIVRAVCVSYSLVRRSFLEQQPIIEEALKNGDVSEAVVLLAKCYQLPAGLVKRVGYAANISCPAMIITRRECASGRLLSCELYFRQSKQDLCAMPQYKLLHAIAHELAHARLIMDKHSLVLSEFAVDITALLVTGNSKGYNEFVASDDILYGYIRAELLGEIYRCLAKYSSVIYLKSTPHTTRNPS